MEERFEQLRRLRQQVEEEAQRREIDLEGTASLEDVFLHIIFSALAILAIAVVYLVPSIIAFKRGHYYKWVIFVSNLFLGWTGVGWLLMLIWAIWPKDKSSYLSPRSTAE